MIRNGSCLVRFRKDKKLTNPTKILEMENLKALATQLLVVTAGVIIALKVKEQMDKAKVAPPATK